MRSGIDFNDIHGTVADYAPAGKTFVARLALARFPVQAVNGFGKKAGSRGFAQTPGTAKKIRMADLVKLNLVLQSDLDMILADEIAEFLRPVFPVKGSHFFS